MDDSGLARKVSWESVSKAFVIMQLFYLFLLSLFVEGELAVRKGEAKGEILRGKGIVEVMEV